MGLLTVHQLLRSRDAFAGFAKEGGRVGSGTLGAGTGGVARCAG
jgi:sulfate adenylyltransferase subunit 1